MITFDVKKVKENITLGELLQKRREQLRLSLAEVEGHTRISQQYLMFLEGGDYRALPADVYVRNFIKAYGQLLQLDIADLIHRYEVECGIYYNSNGLPESEKKHSVLRENALKVYDFIIVSRLVKGVFIALLLSIFFGYIGFSIKQMNESPLLVVENPENNSIITEGTIDVSGYTTRDVQILINGVQILLDTEGKFFTSLDLKKGVNLIHIQALNKHGKESSIHRQVLVDNEVPSDLSLNKELFVGD